MKYLYLLILTLLGSSLATACPTFTITSDDADIQAMSYVNFGINNDIFQPTDPTSTKTATIYVLNDCGEAIENVTLSITGNSGEFCLDQFTDDCPTTYLYTYTLPYDGLGDGDTTSPPVYLYFRALHPGKKKKRLSVDAITESGNDVSASIMLLGETEPRPFQGVE